MIRAAGAVAVLVAVAPGQGAAQNGAEWGELVARLGDPQKCDFAIAEMDKIGPEAVRRLVESVDVGKPDEARLLLYAITELAHHSAAEFAGLVGIERQCDEQLAIDVLWTEAAVLTFLDAATARREAKRCASVLFDLVGSDEAALVARAAPVRFVFVHFEPRRTGGVTVSVEAETEQLVAALEPAKPVLVEYWMRSASRLLGLRGSEASAAVPVLTKRLREPARQREAKGGRPGRLVPYQLGPTDNRAYAVALTRIVPGTAESMEAHGYLARHGNPLEFQQAIEAIRETADKAANAVPHLIAVLELDEAKGRATSQLGEVITTLGILGDAAKDAAPVLRVLVEAGDPQLAPLARAALRSVERR